MDEPNSSASASQQVGDEIDDIRSIPAHPEASSAPSSQRTLDPLSLQTEPNYVYAIGRITPRFPNLSIEKELAQIAGRSDTDGLTDRQMLATILSNRENRYLARQLNWVLMIEGLEVYLLVPQDLNDIELLIECVRPAPRPTDIDVVIGIRGPLAPPELANGLIIPIVYFEQVYSFDIDALVTSIPKPRSITGEKFQPVAEALFTRLSLVGDNAGATDEHRALNYLTVRYPAIYSTAAEAYGTNSTLTSVDVRPSHLSGVRRIVDVIFSFTHRQTDVVESFFCRVDVTNQYPFLVTKLSPYVSY